MEVYNKNRDKNNSISDEIREQNAKLKGAPLKDKLLYFKDYYLMTTVIIAAICVLVVSLAYSILSSPSDTALGVFFYDDTGDSLNSELIDSFAEYMEIDTSEHRVYLDASMVYSADGSSYDAYTDLEKAITYIAAKEVDVIVGNTDTMTYFSDSLHDVTTVLPDDLLEQFEDRLLYAELEDGSQIAIAVDVSDAPKLNEYYYYYGDCEAFWGFVANSENIDTAIEFLRYVYIE